MRTSLDRFKGNIGSLAALYVILRAQGAFSVPLLLFVALLVLIVELSLSVER